MGPKRQPGTAANLVAGQAAGPLGKPNASQNCPQPYPGASGGPDSAANSGRAGPTPPAGRLLLRTGARGPPRPLFVTFSRQRK